MWALEAAGLVQCNRGETQMTYRHNFQPPLDADLMRVRAFVREHGNALAKAAYKLGGRAASARVFLLLETVDHRHRLTRAQCLQLIDLHKLLTLQHVGDPDRIETARFSEIDLASGFIEECCLIADKLEDLLRRISGCEYSNPNENTEVMSVLTLAA